MITHHVLLRLVARRAMHADSCPPSPSSERIAALVRVLPAVVYSVNPSGAFLSAQRSWQRFTGRTPEQSAGIEWLNAYHEDDRPKLCVRFLGHPKGDTWVAFSRLWCAQTGTFKCMLSRSFLLRDQSSQLPRYV